MADKTRPAPDDHQDIHVQGYEPPTLTCLGDLADLTQKDVGAADGTTFQGVDLGS